MRNPGIAAYAVGCVVLGSGIGGWLIFSERAADQRELQRRAVESEQLDRLLTDAVELAHKGDWQAARPLLLEIRRRSSLYSASRVAELINAAEREVPNQEHLELCRAWLDRSDLAAAARELRLVSEGTAQLHAREDLQKDIVRLANLRAADGSVLATWTSDRLKMLELQELAQSILSAVPDHRQAATLKYWADEALQKLDARERLAQSKNPWGEIQNHFRSGDIDTALSLTELCAEQNAKCKAMLPALQRFQEELDGGGDEARLLKLERQILGPAGGYWQAEALVDTAQTAMLKDDYKTAKAAALKALDLSPGHVVASALLARMHALAEMMYLHDPDGPVENEVRRMRDIVALTEADDELHQKAKHRLGELKQ